jgi:hypothetical protein
MGYGDDSPVDPALYHRDDVRPVLAECDIGALYRILKDAGLRWPPKLATLTARRSV